ncbi:hypothetical protein D3C71_1659320 [compost metagenome]
MDSSTWPVVGSMSTADLRFKPRLSTDGIVTAEVFAGAVAAVPAAADGAGEDALAAIAGSGDDISILKIRPAAAV